MFAKGKQSQGVLFFQNKVCIKVVFRIEVLVQEGLAGSLLQSAFRWPILPTGGRSMMYVMAFFLSWSVGRYQICPGISLMHRYTK